VTRSETIGLAPGSLVAGRYRLEKMLGEGGLGSAFAAHDQLLDREVVLKCAPGEGALLREEFLALRGRLHDNTVTVLDFGVLRTAGATYPFYTAERVAGRALSAITERWSWEALRSVMVDVLRALSFFHRLGVLHGDVKPDNVLVNDAGRATLIDLSCCRRLGLPDDGPIAGTPGFVAPERGRGTVTAASDVYGFARTVEALPKPKPIARLIERALRSAPGDRPSVLELLSSLGEQEDAAERSLARSAFVGREHEVARFEEVLRAWRAREPGPRVFRIGGPHGSGRTRLYTELKWRAQVHLPVVEGSARRPGAVASMVNRARGDDPRALELEELLEGAAALGKSGEPVVLAIDDADQLSGRDATQLSAIARSLSANGDLALLLVSASPLGAASECAVELGPLSAAAVAPWIAEVLPSLRAVDVVKITSGLPGEIAALLGEAPADAPGWWSVAFARMSDDARRALARLVAAGRPLPRAWVERAAELSDWVREEDGEIRLSRASDREKLRRALGADRMQSAHAELWRMLSSSSPDLAMGVDQLLWLGDVERADRLLQDHWTVALSAPHALRAVFEAHADVRHPDFLLRAALLLERAGRPQDALGRVVRALYTRPPRALRARLRALAGRIEARLGRRRSVRLLERAEAEAEDVVTRAEIAVDLGVALLTRGAYAQARAAVDRALDDSLPEGLAAELWCTRAMAESYAGNESTSADAMARAHGGDRPGEPARRRLRIRNAAALLAYRQNRLDEAERAYASALALAESEGLDDVITGTALNLGAVAHQLGDWGTALTAYERGLRMATALGLTTSAVHLGFNRAKLLADIGEFDRARAAAELVLEEATREKMDLLVASLESVLGDVAAAGGDERAAREHLTRAAEGFERAGAEREALEVAVAHLELEPRREAALALAPRVKALDVADVSARFHLAASAVAGRSDALRELGEALRLAESSGQRALVAMAHGHLATAYVAAETPTLAARERTEAIAAWEWILSTLDPASREPFRRHPARRALFFAATRPAEGGEAARLTKLLGLYRRLNSAATTQQVLEATMDAAIELTNAERGFLILRGENLRVRAARNMDKETLGNAASKFSRGIAARVISRGEALLTVDAGDDPRLSTSRSVHAMRLKSILCVPVRAGGEVLGAIYLDNRLRIAGFRDEDVELVLALADQAALALARARLMDELAEKTRELEKGRAEIEQLVRSQAAEIARLSATSPARTEPTRLAHRSAFSAILGKSAALRRVIAIVDRVIDADVPVLLRGESGTGKELFARAIHAGSTRKKAPFVAINCGALPDALLEAELFGYVRGAFTGATSDKEGLFVTAHGGTLFLDELGEMPSALQVKLLRVLQEREVRPVGASRSIPVDVRVLSATNRQLKEDVAEGRFREDLFYRVAVVDIELPPLRERVEDIPDLARAVLTRLATQSGRPPPVLSPSALRALVDHPWPGNVRQLENVLTKAFLLGDGVMLEVRDLGLGAPASSSGRGFRPGEAARILAALEQNGWNVADAARALSIPRASFYRKLKRYRLERTPQ
jgi:serine/threonine-protein kinase PknK